MIAQIWSSTFIHSFIYNFINPFVKFFYIKNAQLKLIIGVSKIKDWLNCASSGIILVFWKIMEGKTKG